MTTPLARLRCIESHVAAVRRMVEEDAPFPAIMLQVSAVRGALAAVARTVAEDEVRSRLRAAGAGDAVRLALELRRMLAEGPWTDDAPDARPMDGDPGEATFIPSSARIHALPPRFR